MYQDFFLPRNTSFFRQIIMFRMIRLLLYFSANFCNNSEIFQLLIFYLFIFFVILFLFCINFLCFCFASDLILEIIYWYNFSYFSQSSIFISCMNLFCQFSCWLILRSKSMSEVVIWFSFILFLKNFSICPIYKFL